MTHARLTAPAPQRMEAPRAETRAPKVARSARAARDPRFMRAVDRLQSTTARPAASAAAVQRHAHPLEELPGVARSPVGRSPLARLDRRWSAVLDPQRMAAPGARVSSPQEPSELEAEAVARQVTTMTLPEDAARESAEDGAAAGAPAQTHVPGTLMHEIAAAGPLGRPLPTHVRRFMEPRFRADFRGVRVHTGDQAARLSRQLNAHAFTVGHQVFFGRDRFQPETHAGRELIAHELTHTIQQGATAQERGPEPTAARAPDVSTATPPSAQRLGIDTILDSLADLANAIPGYRMFTIVLGVNPINMNPVDRSAANILRAIVEFMPGGNLITRALDQYGVFDRVGSWIEGQLASLGLSGAALKDALMRFLDGLGLSDLLHPGDVWERAKSIFTTPVDRIITFVKSLAVQVLKFIKDAILRPLAQLASQTPAWDLLIAVLGRNPITGDPVPRTAETLIGGFMKLIGQEEIWENIKQSHAVERAWAWFQGALSALMGFVNELPGLFMQALQSLAIEDIILLPQAFAKVGHVFGGFFERFVSWAGQTIWDLLEIIFAVVAPGVLVYIKKAAAAFRKIIQNPVGFVSNLLAAGKQGLNQFVRNFVTHLKSALIGWLTGSLAGAGLYIPQALSLLEIGKFVLSLLGITWPKIRAKIVAVIGEPAMVAIQAGLDIVVALASGGVGAAWELIKQRLSDLKDMMIESIIGFVKDKVVSAAVTKLLSMLSPVGAFIQAIIGIYNTIMFFVERLKQIAAVAAAFIDSISAIANGVIGAAANKVESTMAGLLTLVISFLARIAGLGKVSDAVVNFIKKVQAKVDHAIDTAIKFVVERARAFLRTVFGAGGRRDERTPAQKQADLDRGAAEADGLLSSGRMTPDDIRSRLPAIRAKYRLKTLDLVTESTSEAEDIESDHIEAEVNPRTRKPTHREKRHPDLLMESFTLSRPTFTIETKEELKDLYLEQHNTNIRDRPIVKRGMARRHIVSSADMGEHYQTTLTGKLWSAGKGLLTRGIALAKVDVAIPLSHTKIKDGAATRLGRFFNYTKNLFLGDSRQNSSIGRALDEFKRGMGPQKLEQHVAEIKKDWALDRSFTPTRG